jgi:hypothetical protein
MRPLAKFVRNSDIARHPGSSSAGVERSEIPGIGSTQLDEVKLRQGKVYLLVDIPPIMHFMDEEQLLLFVDLENDPYLACPHSQKALPLSIQSLDIQLFEGNNPERFNIAHE